LKPQGQDNHEDLAGLKSRAVSSGNDGFGFVAPGRGKQASIAPDVAEEAIDARR